VRHEAKYGIDRTTPPLQIMGYDIEPSYIKMAEANAKRATVERDITFEQQDVKNLWIDQQYGIMITNAPYGIRIANFYDLNKIYIELHKAFRKKMGWSVYVLTADKQFPNYFKRTKPDRVRKLYNGRIETNYYQYYGEKPPQ
jgi:putative N6-adenine-specific DNA methylase